MWTRSIMFYPATKTIWSLSRSMNSNCTTTKNISFVAEMRKFVRALFWYVFQSPWFIPHSRHGFFLENNRNSTQQAKHFESLSIDQTRRGPAASNAPLWEICFWSICRISSWSDSLRASFRRLSISVSSTRSASIARWHSSRSPRKETCWIGLQNVLSSQLLLWWLWNKSSVCWINTSVVDWFPAVEARFRSCSVNNLWIVSC